MNSFGKLFRVHILGESHGPSVGIIIDGCPAGLPISTEDFMPDIERRKAEIALCPEIVGIEAAPEIAENGFDVPRLRVHGGQHQKANGLAGRVDHETAPAIRALTNKSICNPSHCVIRRRTLPRSE